ncbi:MAG: hypothetical protein L0Y42_01120, partial [Phycisphaerales bacterium]|nr:hypothetical protein [Phycisphaerales bacterium]
MSHPRQIRLMVHGARGKMGARIVALARDDARFNIVAAHDVHDSAQADRLAHGSIDVLIDFSSDHGARRAATLARTLRCALLVGTTGLSQDSLDFIEQSARWVPVMVAANTSL